MQRLSVIVTAHNMAGLIGRALDSVSAAIDVLQREQGAPEVEVITVDDGSTDDTTHFITEAIKGRSLWRLFRREQASSPSCARNAGLAEAAGDIFFFLDGDDLFLPEHLRVCWNILRESDAHFVKTAVHLADPVHADWKRRIEGSVVINLAVRRSSNESVGGFPDYHLFRRDGEGFRHETDIFFKIEDMFYNLALGRTGKGVGVLEETVEYCRYPGNAYDRQYEKFCRPFGQYPQQHSPGERFRLRLAELIFQEHAPTAPANNDARADNRESQINPRPSAGHSMHTPESILEQAHQALAHKQPDHAERLAQRAIGLAPSLPAAWRVLADAQRSQGKHEDALKSRQHLARLASTNADAAFDVALELLSAGHEEQALAHLHELLKRWPDYVEALLQTGVLLAQRGRLPEALSCMEKAVHLRPDHAKARNNLGVALAQANRPQEAIDHLREAQRLDPGYAEAGYNLGNVLGMLNRRDEAIAAYHRALNLKPDHYGVLNNLGLLLQEAQRPGEAAILLRQAVRLRPQAAEAHNNLGLVLADLGRFEQAEACYHEALRLNPGYAEAHTNLGCSLKELNRVEEALACFDMALRLTPDSRSSLYNRALTLLQAGRWEQAWKDYEYRWGRKGMPERPMAGPRWNGTSLAGKTILVWCEQGLGDAIQFVRYASLLAERGARVVLECPQMLMRLFSTCPGIDLLVAEGEPLPSHDAQVPMMSLPGMLGTTVDNVPCHVPYLSAEPERVAAWRRRLPPNGKFRVGIVWQGNPRFGMDRWRSVPLERFAPLAAVDGVELVSLQKGPGVEQLKSLRRGFAVTELHGAVDAEGTFLDTAAVMKCLDLVVCVDTAAGHLAGALGLPVWLVISSVPDWRWLRDQAVPAWYRTMQLFRQPTLGEWEVTFRRLTDTVLVLLQGDPYRGVGRSLCIR
jgi:tetratricopeptide (TPR) repeat protein